MSFALENTPKSPPPALLARSLQFNQTLFWSLLLQRGAQETLPTAENETQILMTQSGQASWCVAAGFLNLQGLLSLMKMWGHTGEFGGA